MKKIAFVPGAVGLLLVWTTGAAGQEAREAEPPPSATPSLRVELVVNKLLAGKKVSSLVYAFPCGDRKTTMKLGVEVPVPVRKGGDLLEFQYRNVGANIECEARPMQGGRFGVRLGFEQSSLHLAGDKTAAGEQTLESRAANPPVFRTAMGQLTAVLREGQTTQAIMGTDPVSGEVTVVDVTLSAMK